ncbi:MAG: tetratricopeptide repeat protein [Blastocatellia bacterium]|nr:tetratricopeptide repeat protein [Blastocatellia bacterium]
MSFRRYKRMGGKPRRHLSEKAIRSLDQANFLFERKQWAEAQKILAVLDQEFPNREEILAPLALTHYYLNELPAYLTLCIRLNALLPNDAEHRLALAHAYLMNARFMLAYLTFREFLRRWPEHVEAPRARESFDRLESMVGEILGQLKLSGDHAIELAALHEESQVLMEAAKYREGIAKAEELLRHEPNYTAAYNNISLMQYHCGEITKAVAAAEHVLALDAENFHALANLSRYLLLVGREEEARGHLEKLKGVESDAVDRWLKQAETCAILGDDQGVLDALAGCEATGDLEIAINGFQIYHLAAVAQLRLGREDEARELWEKCLSITPYSTALENLNDLQRPVYQRNGPWPFPFAQWIAKRVIDDLDIELRRVAKRGGEDLAPGARRFLRKHPYVENLLRLMFDRGDPAGRDFAIDLAIWAKTPETIAMLRQFGLGQKGPDRLRTKALQHAHRLGGMDSGIVRFWSNGDWHEVYIHLTEIYDGTESDLPPKAQALYIASCHALDEGDAVLGEKLLKEALAIVPDSPQLLNNLAVASAHQGRSEESEDLLRQVMERNPDYLFARTNLANHLIAQGNSEEAEKLLDPLRERTRLHVTEVASLYNTYINLNILRGDLDAARDFLQMLERLAPNDKNLPFWRRQLRRKR